MDASEKRPEKLYALRGGPVPGYLKAALIVNHEACERNGIEVSTYIPADAPNVLTVEEARAILEASQGEEFNFAAFDSACARLSAFVEGKTDD